LEIFGEHNYQSGGLSDEVQARVKLSKLMMAAGRVGNDLNTLVGGRSDKVC
jgi:hypothetical protein